VVTPGIGVGAQYAANVTHTAAVAIRGLKSEEGLDDRDTR
jgi:hypothetical protein